MYIYIYIIYIYLHLHIYIDTFGALAGNGRVSAVAYAESTCVLISQDVLIIWFNKVNSPTTSSNYPLL